MSLREYLECFAEVQEQDCCSHPTMAIYRLPETIRDFPEEYSDIPAEDAVQMLAVELDLGGMSHVANRIRACTPDDPCGDTVLCPCCAYEHNLAMRDELRCRALATGLTEMISLDLQWQNEPWESGSGELRDAFERGFSLWDEFRGHSPLAGTSGVAIARCELDGIGCCFPSLRVVILSSEVIDEWEVYDAWEESVGMKCLDRISHYCDPDLKDVFVLALDPVLVGVDIENRKQVEDALEVFEDLRRVRPWGALVGAACARTSGSGLSELK